MNPVMFLVWAVIIVVRLALLSVASAAAAPLTEPGIVDRWR
jgi:hypothetical protein